MKSPTKLEIFGGKSWNLDITREERFFCQELYHELDSRGIDSLLKLLAAHGLRIGSHKEYEIGYEVCFYRDLKYAGLIKGGNNDFSLKRTFDLCLMFETEMIIIEAKVFEGLTTKQIDSFAQDRFWVPTALGQSNYKVHIIALISSNYAPRLTSRSFFDVILTWEQISMLYPNNKILAAANAQYKVKPG